MPVMGPGLYQFVEDFRAVVWAALAAESKARIEQMEQARALQCKEGDGCGAH